MADTFSYKTKTQELFKEIVYNYELIKDLVQVEKKAAPTTEVSNTWPKSLQAYYKELNGTALFWRHSDYADQPHMGGRVKILDAATVAKDTQGLVWFDHTPADSPLRQFRLIDFFAEEAAVGFYDHENASDALFLYHFEGEPLPLQVNFQGYYELMLYAKGFFYWQQALRAIIEGKENDESKDFKIHMPKLFPDFRHEVFVALFEKFKI